MLIMVFVFGTVDYAHASENVGVNDVVSHFSISGDYLGYSGTFSGGYIVTVHSVQNNSGKFVAFNDYNSHGFVSDEPFSVTTYEYYKGKYESYKSLSASLTPNNLYFYSFSGATFEYDNEICTMLCFRKEADALNYLLTGEINNPIYQPKENIEFDSDIEVPLNLDIRLNGNSDFVPNVKISCNQTEQVENRYLEIQYSIGYKATWSLLGGIGLNVKSKTSPTLYGSIEQLEDSFDNGGTSFETILSLTKLSHSVAPDKEAFSKYEPTPKTYWSLKEIKNDNSEMKIWCRNRVGNKASKWVMVSGDGYKANFDVVDSDENGNPTDLKDDVANSNTGYGSNYWNNRDTTPQEDYSSTNVKTNLKDLKSNYASLANFYKELFSFLPAEIWIILIGLVSTMVIIAIVKFVRG